MNDVLDIWCKCFFGYVGKDSTRLCAMNDKPMACKDDCPYKITRREANNICGEFVRQTQTPADFLIKYKEGQSGTEKGQ